MQTKSDILLFAFEYPPVSGGIARLCEEIGKSFSRDHVNAQILTQTSDMYGSSPALPETRVNNRRPLREWQAFRWLKHRSPKALTVCGIWYPEGLIAHLAGVRQSVILAHGAELLPPVDFWRRPLWKHLQRRVLERASLVITNSEYTRRMVAEAAPKARVEAISLAVDTRRFAPRDREAAKARYGVSGKCVLSTVSRLVPYKGHDVVLRTIASLPAAEREQLIYLIVGTGSHQPILQALVLELGLADQVRWLGFVSEDDLPEVYSASDLFILCTRETPEQRSVEGFGLVFLEAQSCGVPVVGTRTGGIPEAIEDGNGGWLIEQDDGEALAAILHRLLDSPPSFRSAGARARQRVLREGTWDQYRQRFFAALDRAGISAGCYPRGVTVVIPTLNRGTYLLDTVADLLAQEHRPLEILIVDQSGEASPALRELALRHAEVISYHWVDFRGLPLARNYGWQHARYEAIVFVDDDIRCNPSLVTEHLQGLSQPGVAMVAGGIDERVEPRTRTARTGHFNFWTATPSRGFESHGEGMVKQVPGGNFSIWRSALQAAGGFDEALAAGAALYEETELCLRVQRLGFEVYFNGSARITHLAAANGGCRVLDVESYLHSLAHNRAIVIRRNLRWFQMPFAWLRLLLLCTSYAAHYRAWGIFRSGIAGFVLGVSAAKHPPLCSQYKTGAAV